MTIKSELMVALESSREVADTDGNHELRIFLEFVIGEVQKLEKDSKLLAALQAGGVRDWEWFEASIDEHFPEYWNE